MPPKSKTPKKKDADKLPPIEEKFQVVEVSTKDPRTVVIMLDSPEAVIVCKACEAINKYVEKSDANCVELKELGAVGSLVKLLSSTDKAVRSYSVICLTSMANNADVRHLLLKTDCIPPLLALLTPDEELITQERSSFTVAQLAGDYSFKVKLLRGSAHQPLINLAQSTDPDIQRNCVKALSLMVEHFEARPAILEAGGLSLLLEYLSSEYEIIQELVLKALHSCSHNAGCRKALIEGDGLGKIVSFLGKKEWSDLHTLAVSVLALILEEADSMVALQGSDLLQQLLTHIKESTVNEVKKQSARTLSKAATNSVNQKILHEHHVEKTFLELISHEDCGVVVAACDGLTEMASLSSSRQTVGSEGGVASLVECLSRDEAELRAAASRTLATLISEAPANCKLLGETGGVESIVQLLQDQESQCRQYAADCVTTMAPDESLRSELITSGAVSALVDCLTFTDTSVQSSSAQALGMLSCDSEARSQLMASNGIPPLLSCLQSPNSHLVQTTSWTLAIAAQSTEVAEAVCQMGGLDLIKKLCSSVGHAQSSSARMALNKLLNSNLSAKYWVTGRLDQMDLTTESEFFDAGLALSSSQPFTGLSELLGQPVTRNQPILTVSLLAKPPPPVNEETPGNLDGSQSTVSVTSRSKSRQQGPKDGKRKGGRVERDQESRVSQNSEDVTVAGTKPCLPGLLPVDAGLWAHISHTREHIRTLNTVEEQVQQLAKYVSECLGGAVERSGPFGYELAAGELQRQLKSNTVPLGEITAGGFRHRALLFKVLCDQLGVPCSLVRGEYGRHWNEVCVRCEESVRVCLVDLMFTPGNLIDNASSSAAQYQHI